MTSSTAFPFVPPSNSLPPLVPAPSSLAAAEVEAFNKSTKLYDVLLEPHQVPIIYRSEYNISFLGLEKLHPFDAGKWGKVIQFLKEKKLLVGSSYIQPKEATKHDLLRIHKQRYINSLKWSVNVARITEVAPTALLPNCLLQRAILKPFRYQTGGSILAGKCAVERGWSINIGGGFHHCSAGRGGGFCAYADITLSIQFVLDHYDHIKKVLIIDLDAHQGNGHERDFMGRRDIYILDIYNRLIYPRDDSAKKAISRRVELSPYTEDPRYLSAVETHVEGALNEFRPDLVLYNAGTDILEGDPLGMLSISRQGIIKRDEIVWQKVRRRNLPIIMLTSGGYQRSTAAIIADSIANLHTLSLIDLKPSTVVTSPDSAAATDGSASCKSPTKKPSSASSSPLPFKYSFLSRCAGGGGGRKKSTPAMSASESTTPVSGRHSITDSTTSSPPPNTSDFPTPLPLKSDNPPPHQPPSFINIAAHIRHSIVSEESTEYGTPRSTVHPILHANSSPDTPAGSSLHPSMTQQASITDSVTPPSPAFRSVASSINAVHCSTTPPHHKSLDSTLSTAQNSSHHTGGSITTPPSHYESADSINMEASLVSNNAFAAAS